MKKNWSRHEELFWYKWAAVFETKPTREHRFHPVRRWRFDFAWPEKKVAVEIEGGQWISGRHQRPTGFAKDCEKYNAAARLGWKVLRYTGQDVQERFGEISEEIMELLQ